jgi:hypothetical protein
MVSHKFFYFYAKPFGGVKGLCGWKASKFVDELREIRQKLADKSTQR